MFQDEKYETNQPQSGNSEVSIADIHAMLHEMGYDPDELSPEAWQELVEYIQSLVAEGGSLADVLPMLDIATAAGVEAGQLREYILGMDHGVPEGPQVRDGGVRPGTGGGRMPVSGPGDRQPTSSDPLVDFDGALPASGADPDPTPDPDPEEPPSEITDTDGDDVIQGGDHGETITLGAGNDVIDAGGGDDRLDFSGNLDSGDVVDGGEGYDVLTFTDGNGNGRDELDNVTNVEKIVLGESATRVTTVDDLVSDGASLEVDGSGLGNESMVFDGSAETDGSFDITSAAGEDTLRGGAGADTLRSGDGADRLFGNGGNDVLDGGDGDDRMEGGEGNDSLFGGSGHDILTGDGGNDLLFGGVGSDSLHGDAGSDTFRYESLADGGDKVFDFDTTDDQFEFLSGAFDSDAGFVSGRFKGYDGENGGIGSSEAAFVFDEQRNELWYDANGDEAGGETFIANVTGDDVTAADIIFV